MVKISSQSATIVHATIIFQYMVRVLNANIATLRIMLQESRSDLIVWHTIRIMHVAYFFSSVLLVFAALQINVATSRSIPRVLDHSD